MPKWSHPKTGASCLDRRPLHAGRWLWLAVISTVRRGWSEVTSRWSRPGGPVPVPPHPRDAVSATVDRRQMIDRVHRAVRRQDRILRSRCPIAYVMWSLISINIITRIYSACDSSTISWLLMVCWSCIMMMMMMMMMMTTIITSCAGCRHNMPPPPASWPFIFWLWKWCPSRMWCGLPLCQFSSS